MPKITFELDGGTNHDTRPWRTSAKKLGLLSSLTITDALKRAVMMGFTGNPSPSNPHMMLKGTPADIAAKRNDLVSGGCEVIATIGGLWVTEGILGTSKPFVSLVGAVPDSVDGMCFGGVSLQTVSSNAARRALLRDKGVADRNAIALYRHSLVTSVHAAEEKEWNDNTKIITSSGDTFNSYKADFDGIPAAIKGVVISASPAFQENRVLLVVAANTWLLNTPMGDHRYVIYPLQNYTDGFPQSFAANAAAGDGISILFGPHLYRACTLLGQMAALAIESETGWFQSVPNIKIEIPQTPRP